MMEGKIADMSKRNIYIRLIDEVQSTIKIDYIYIYLNKKFNWLQKKMISALFGFEIFDGEKED